MSQKDKVFYNEHDQNQVNEMLRKQKRKRNKRRKRLLIISLIFILIIAFFISDFSKVQTITITGNQCLTKDDIMNTITIRPHKSINLLNSSGSIEEQVEKLSFVKKAKVDKDFFGNVTIEVTENTPIAYSIINNVINVIDENGTLVTGVDQRLMGYLERTPVMNNFNQDNIKKFATEYAKIPSQVRNQVSEINYSPIAADESRCEFIMDDGKILYLRIEDMALQLKGNNYENVINARPNYKYYNFVGKNCYASNTLSE